MGIRVTTAKEEDAVIALWTACKLTRPWNDPQRDFRLAVNTPTSDILVLFQNDRLLASIMVGFDGHRGWVYYLAVCASERRKGWGRTLISAAENWLTERGAPKIQLMVRDDNRDAIAFYEALGWEHQPVMTLGKRLDGIAGA